METVPSEYKKSTERERFSRQLDRDLSRKSQRLSQATIRKLISNDTAQWAKAIYDQKLAQNNSTNSASQQSSPSFATTQSTESPIPSSNLGAGGSGGSSDNGANASSDTIGALPTGTSLGDILYWDPAILDWAILSAPQGDLKGLVIKGGAPFWLDGQIFDVCEDGEPVQYRIIGERV
jgi:hypothetical protein